MGEGGGDRGDGQVIAIASSLVGGVVNAVEKVVVSAHSRGGRVDGGICDGVVGLGEHQRRSFFSMGG